MMTPTNAVSTTAGTALLVCVPLPHSKKPNKWQNFGLSLHSQQLPQVLLDPARPMLKILKRSIAIAEMFVVGVDLSDWKTGNMDMIREYMKPIPK